MESEVTQSAGFFRLLAWFEKNRMQVTYGVAGAIVLGLIIWFVIDRREQGRIAADEALSKVFVPQITSGANARNDNIAASYLKVASEYAGSPAAARAQFLAATSLFTEGKYAEAQTAFEKFRKEHSGNPLALQAQLGGAAALDAQGKTNEAFNAYKSIVDVRRTDPATTQAKFALARLYVAQNKPEMALPLYEDITKTEPYGTALNSEAGMRAEELRQKYPQLTPPPVSATNAISITPAAK